MAISNYIKRAEDSLDLSLVSDAFLIKVKDVCKGAITHSLTTKVKAFTNKTKALELALEVQLTLLRESGFFAKFRRNKIIRELKARIAAVKSEAVEWINRAYRYFFATPILKG